MKKCYSLLRWLLIWDVLNRRLLAKTNQRQCFQNHHHHFFVSGIGQKKTVDAAKICGGAENVVKTETANDNKWIVPVLCPKEHLYSAGERVCIAHNNCMSCPSIWATLSTLLINILLGSLQLFLHSDQPLSEVKIIRSAVSASRGEAALSTPEAVVASRLTDCFDVQPTTTNSAITQSIISSWHQLTPLRVFCISATTSR